MSFWWSIAGQAIRESCRRRGAVGCLLALSALSWMGLLLPGRLSSPGHGAAAALLGVQALGSFLFAAYFVAWPMARESWCWSMQRAGPLPMGPSAIILAQALGSAIAWGLALALLLAAQVLGVMVIDWLLLPGLLRDLAWVDFLVASALVGLLGFWLQALARFLASFLPPALSTLSLLALLIGGHYWGLDAISHDSIGSWLRPGLEYLSQADLMGADSRSSLWRATLGLAGALLFNLLAAMVLGRRNGQLAKLDPGRDGH